MSRSSVRDLLATELIGLTTVRTPVLLVGLGLVVTTVLAVQPVASSGQDGTPSIGTAGLLLVVVGSAARAKLLALVLGVLVMTGPRRHGTLTPALLQEPRRWARFAAGAAAAALAGLLIGLVSAAASVLVVLGSGAGAGGLFTGGVALVLAGQLLCYPLYALLGAGIGALLAGSQPIAVLLPVAWFLLGEGLIGGLDRAVSPWLPGGLAAGLADSADLPGVLPVAVSGALLLILGLVLLAGGGTRFARADLR